MSSQGLGHLLFPGLGVSNDVVDMALIPSGGVSGARGFKFNVTSGAHRIVRPKNWLQNFRARLRRCNRAIDLVPQAFVGFLPQQKHLRESIVFASYAIREPAVLQSRGVAGRAIVWGFR